MLSKKPGNECKYVGVRDASLGAVLMVVGGARIRKLELVLERVEAEARSFLMVCGNNTDRKG